MDERDEAASGLGENSGSVNAPTAQGDGDAGSSEPTSDAPAEQQVDAAE